MYVKIDGQLKSIRRIELTSDSTTFLIHSETETGIKEVYKCPSELSNYYRLRKVFSSDIYIPGEIVCGNKDFLIYMTLSLVNIDNQHQIIVSFVFNNITEDFRVITESTNDEQISTFICTR